jgi:hypothetical protein
VGKCNCWEHRSREHQTENLRLSDCYTFTLNVSVQLTVLQVRIQEALGSDLGLGDDYSDGVVSSGECQDEDGYQF